MATHGGTPGVIRRPRLPIIAAPPQSDPNSPVHGYQEFCNGIEVCASMDSPFIDCDDVIMDDCGAVYLSVDDHLNRCVSSDCLDTTSMDIDICTLDNRLDWREEQLYSISDNDSNNSDTRAQCEEEPRDDLSDIVSAKKQKVKLREQGSQEVSRTSSDVSELNRRSAELEKFFDEMGLEKNIDPVVANSVQPQFENLSSAESQENRSASSRDKKSVDPERLFNDKTYIVERNSRIMRWLNNVKKTTKQSDPSAPHP